MGASSVGTPLGRVQTGKTVDSTANGQWDNGDDRSAGGGYGNNGSRISGGHYQDPSQPYGQQAPATVGGGPSKSYNPGYFEAPSIASDVYTSGQPFNDPNAGNIYNMIQGGMNNAMNAQAPIAGVTQLGRVSQYGGAQMSPQMMLNGAQMSPAMMTSGAQLGTAQDSRYAGAQDAQINALYAQAQGQGPSVAETQAKQQAQQNIAMQMAAMGSQRGAGSAAIGARAAADQGAAANQAAAQAGALGRSQEAMGAQQQVTAALQGARGQSQATSQMQAQLAQQAALANQGAYNQFAQGQAQLNQQAALANQQTAYGASGQNAQMAQQAGLANSGALNQSTLQQGQMNQQTSMANQQSQLSQEQLNNQQYAQMVQAYMQQNQGDIANNAAYQQLLANEELQKYGIDEGVAVNTSNNEYGLAGAGASFAGTLGGAAISASDARAKTSVRSASRDVRSFLGALNGFIG